MVKNLPTIAGDTGDVGLILGLGKSAGEGNGSLLHCSYLGSPMDRGAWRATVHGVAESWHPMVFGADSNNLILGYRFLWVYPHFPQKDASMSVGIYIL